MEEPGKNRYKNFNEKDFICDPLFQEWILNPTQVNINYWTNFLLENPEKKNIIDNSATFINNLKLKEHLPEGRVIKRNFLQHLAQIEELERRPIRVINIKRVVKIAAVVGAIIIMGAFLYRQNSNKEQVLRTQYGEIKQVTLPDSTIVILNSNSQVSFKRDWKSNKPREIWLEGEGYFNVKHLNKDTNAIAASERFLVHGKDLTIEVLGTSFDIRQRRGKTEVVLKEGKIRLTVNTGTVADIIMKPGEMIKYSASDGKVYRMITSAENYIGWKDKKLILNNPTVEEIIGYLEDNYGRKIQLVDSTLLNKKIQGPILLNNLDDAMFILSTVLNVRVEKDGNVIKIGSK